MIHYPANGDPPRVVLTDTPAAIRRQIRRGGRGSRRGKGAAKKPAAKEAKRG
jgi:hypothetical protein